MISIDDRITLSVPEAAAAIGVSESVIRRAFYKGEFEHRYLGRKILIFRDSLEAWVRRLPTEPEVKS